MINMVWLRKITIVCATLCCLGSNLHSQAPSLKLYSEKPEYMVGEPVFLVAELTNERATPISVGDWVGCSLSFHAPVDPEPRKQISLYGCTIGGTGGDCPSSILQVNPKQTLVRRTLLPNVLPDRPGDYEVEPTWLGAAYIANGENSHYRITVSIHLVPVTQAALVATYQPIVHSLNSSDLQQRSLAVQAIAEYPQLFLEDIIVKLSEDPQDVQAAIEGLKKLNTPRARRRLSELAASPDEAIRQPATTALAEANDPEYCEFMLQAVRARLGYSASIAARAAGLLCGEKAIPELVRAAQGKNPILDYEIAYALGNTGSGEAVPILIGYLRQSDADLRRAAEDALATLTHRTDEAGGSDDAFLRWNTYWSVHASTAKIFRPSECDMPFESLSKIAQTRMPRTSGR